MQAIWSNAPRRERIQALITASTVQSAMGDFELQFDSEGTFAIVYDQDDKIMAGAIGVIACDWAYIEMVWVDEELRGQGIGQKVMLAVESYISQIGLNGIYLYTIDFQAPDFYRKLGYQRCGVLPNRPQGHIASYFYKTDLAVDGLNREFLVENPVTESSFEIVETGLVQHAEAVKLIEAHERLLLLEDDAGRLLGGLFAHEFWGYVDVHLLFAETQDGLMIILDELDVMSNDRGVGIIIFAHQPEHHDLLSQHHYQRIGEIPNRPTDKTTMIWVRPQPST